MNDNFVAMLYFTIADLILSAVGRFHATPACKVRLLSRNMVVSSITPIPSAEQGPLALLRNPFMTLLARAIPYLHTFDQSPFALRMVSVPYITVYSRRIFLMVL